MNAGDFRPQTGWTLVYGSIELGKPSVESVPIAGWLLNDDGDWGPATLQDFDGDAATAWLNSVAGFLKHEGRSRYLEARIVQKGSSVRRAERVVSEELEHTFDMLLRLTTEVRQEADLTDAEIVERVVAKADVQDYIRVALDRDLHTRHFVGLARQALRVLYRREHEA